MEYKVPQDFWANLSEKEQYQLYQMSRLLTVMSDLRQPDGCPWDREQTHDSLKPYLLEETYEVLEQLEKGNMSGIVEELGDLLLQIVFHAQVADEANHFNMADVAKGIADKLIRRHPHIFANVKAANTEEVLTNWERIKAEEKKAKGQAEGFQSILARVNRHQPAIMEAYDIQKKVAKVGFDWDSIHGAFDKVEEELNEIRDAEAAGSKEEVQAEIGDLLFAVMNVARIAGVHGELALRQTNEKFRRRFQGVEEKVQQHGGILGEMTLEELDRFWDEVKQEELGNI